jgi:ABC-2 type transport system permease protein
MTRHTETIESTVAHATARAMAARPPASSGGGLLLSAWTLWLREMVRFLRQPSRIVGLVAAPLLFWLLLGTGFGASFHSGQADGVAGTLGYFFPGMVVMIVLFSSVFSNMSTIEDRREGFLLSVMVAPMPRAGLVLGKILGGTTQAMVPGLLFLLLAPLAGFHLQLGAALLAAAVLFLIAVSLTGLGFAIAWWMDSAQGFHAVLNLVLMPAWVLSGALFPLSGASAWIRAVMRVNPMTYEVEALRGALTNSASLYAADGFGLARSLQLTVLFAVLTLAAALVWSGRPSVKHLA